MSVLNKVVLASLPYFPRPVMRHLARRYIAGETLEDALAKLAELAGRGHPGILDILGENVADEAAAREVARSYKAAASAVAERKLPAYVSVKPTHVGLTMREELCFELYSDIAAHCAPLGLFVRIEMEDHPTTDGTLRVFERLRKRHPNVGIVLQSRLFRTPDDIARLAPGPLDVRVVKGIYLEPPAIAHTDPEAIRTAYVACTKLLLERDAKLSLATHDEGLGERCLSLLREFRRPRESYEFQVLLGVREPLWQRWREAGHTVRVYVPYGPDWRAYSTRRLRKNPQILSHVMKDTLFFWR